MGAVNFLWVIRFIVDAHPSGFQNFKGRDEIAQADSGSLVRYADADHRLKPVLLGFLPHGFAGFCGRLADRAEDNLQPSSVWIGELGRHRRGAKPLPSTTCRIVSVPRLSSVIAASPARITDCARLVLSDNTGRVILS